jgi:hypothetical protein
MTTRKLTLLAGLCAAGALPLVLLSLAYRRPSPDASGLAPGTRWLEVVAEPVGRVPPMATRGKRAVLFFSPSCPSCRATVAGLRTLLRAEPGRGLDCAPIALVSIGSLEETIAFAPTAPAPLYHDRQRTSFKAAHGVVVPYLVVLADDTVLSTHSGLLGSSQLRRVLSPLCTAATGGS